MEKGDVDFILHSWLRSYFHGSAFVSGIPHDVYFDYHQRVARRILARPTTTVWVAALTEDPDVMLGYLVTEDAEPFGKIAHYAYVKADFRNSGLASDLIKRAGFDFKAQVFITHRMRDMGFLFERFPNLTYNPYLL